MALEPHTGSGRSSSDCDGESVVCQRLVCGGEDRREDEDEIGDPSFLGAALEIKGEISGNLTGTESSAEQSRGQRSQKRVIHLVDETDAEDVHVSDAEDPVSTGTKQVENLLEECESLKQRINDLVKVHGSALQCRVAKSQNITMETSGDRDDLIIIDESEEGSCESGLSDDDVIMSDREILKSCRRQTGDAANGRKQRILDGIEGETGSDGARSYRVTGSSIKRWKHWNTSSKRKDPDNGNIEIIKVDDDDDVEICSSVPDASKRADLGSRGNAGDRDCEILVLPGRGGGGAEGQTGPEKIKSCKQDVSHRHRVKESEVGTNTGAGAKSQRIQKPRGTKPRDQVEPLQSTELDPEWVLMIKQLSSDADVQKAEGERGDKAESNHNVSYTIIQSSEGRLSRPQGSDEDESFQTVTARGTEKEERSEPQREGVTEEERARDEGQEAPSREKHWSPDVATLRIRPGSHVNEVSNAAEERAPGPRLSDVPASPVGFKHRITDVKLRPTSSRVGHGTDYGLLQREENINRIRARLRMMEKKLRTLRNTKS